MKLKSGEVICPKCKGKKKIKADYSLNDPDTFIWVEGQKVACDICLGTGKLDWIENMMGKKRDRQVLDGTSFVPHRFTNIITSIPSGPKVGDLYVDGDINTHKYTDNKWKIIK